MKILTTIFMALLVFSSINFAGGGMSKVLEVVDENSGKVVVVGVSATAVATHVVTKRMT